MPGAGIATTAPPAPIAALALPPPIAELEAPAPPASHAPIAELAAAPQPEVGEQAPSPAVDDHHLHPGTLSAGESFRARVTGGLVAQVPSFGVDIACGVVASLVTGTSITRGLEQSAVSVALRFTTDMAAHALATGMTQLPQVHKRLNKLHANEATTGPPKDPAQIRQESIQLTRDISTFMTQGESLVGSVAYAALASRLVNQTPNVSDLVSSAISGVVSTGFLTAGAYGMYVGNAAFRERIDRELLQVRNAIFGALNGSPPAPDVELAESTPIRQDDEPLRPGVIAPPVAAHGPTPSSATGRPAQGSPFQ